MDKRRYFELSTDPNAKLTNEEMDEGWFFCGCEWDGLLIQKSDPEAESCYCYQDSLKPENTE